MKLALLALALVPVFGMADTITKGTGLAAGTAGFTTSVYVTGGAVAGNLPLTVPSGTGTTLTVPPGWATAHPPNGMPTFTTKVQAPIPGSSIPVPATVKLPIPGAALGRLAVNLAKSWSGPIGTAAAIYTFLQETSYRPVWNGTTNQMEFYKEVSTQYCASGTCYEFQVTGPSGVAPTFWARTPQLACDDMRARYNNRPGLNFSMTSAVAEQYGAAGYQWQCRSSASYNTGGSIFSNRIDTLNYRTVAATNEVNLTLATEDAVAADIAAKSGWPSQSTVDQAIAFGMLNHNLSVPDLSPVITPDTPTGTDTAGKPYVTTADPVPTVTTQQNADGTSTTTTTTHETTTTFNGDRTYATNDKITSTQVIKNPDGSVVGTPKTTVTTSAPNVKPGDAGAKPTTEPTVTCGLPTTPACKMDETGTPAAQTLDGKTEAQNQLKNESDFAADPKSKLPVFPTLKWSFKLPTGCTAIDLGDAYKPYLTAIDICPYVALFHDLMSVVWTMGAIFGAISTFWRSTYSAN